ncbi:hypothetical protein BDR07DRAFT_1494272 [Suillus spraguei]|nr:hypothetical protein BDR07DRAFT_1494272 [Suillus spraguei]
MAASSQAASCLASPTHSASQGADSDFADKEPVLGDLDSTELNSDLETSELDWILDGSGDNDKPCAIEGYEAFDDGPSAHANSDTCIGALSDFPPLKSDLPWHAIDARTPPSLGDASSALNDLKTLLRPPCNNGHGCKPSGLPSVLEKRLQWIEYFLRAYVNGMTWSAAALQMAQFVGKGTHMSRTVQQWSRAYILDHKDLPYSQYGKGLTKSQIEDEDLEEELLTHLQLLSKYVTAKAVVDYIARLDVQRQNQLCKGISLRTAQNWMENCGFRWMTTKNGQYIDGHEQEDVINYWQNTFLPAWYAINGNT